VLSQGALPVAAANASSGKSAPALRTAGTATAAVVVNKTSTLKVQEEVLKNLLSHLKSSISKDNKEEEESKKHNQDMIERLKKRLESDRAKMNDTKLSARDRAMYANDTHLEERELQYWTRGRELQHGMYHANLKMTHGLMSRVKTVMQAYEEVLKTGHLDADMSKMLHAAAASISKATPPQAAPTTAAGKSHVANATSTASKKPALANATAKKPVRK